MPVTELVHLLWLLASQYPAARIPRDAVESLLEQHLGVRVEALQLASPQHAPLPTTRLWTAEDVQEYLGLGRTLVAEMTSDGTLPCVRVSERVTRYRPEDVRAWVASRVRGARPSTGTRG